VTYARPRPFSALPVSARRLPRPSISRAAEAKDHPQSREAIRQPYKRLEKDCADIETPIPASSVFQVLRKGLWPKWKPAVAGFLLGILILAVIAQFLPLSLLDNQTVFRFFDLREPTKLITMWQKM
jgi:hypothetical protein